MAEVPGACGGGLGEHRAIGMCSRCEQRPALLGIFAACGKGNLCFFAIRKDHTLDARVKISVNEYLEEVAEFSDDQYGNRVRGQFKDVRGTSELAMLVAPTSEELAQLRRAVAIMTPSEKQDADRLSDEQVEKIAADAHVDPANFAIFINGYALVCKRAS